jgi:hypothetical protein
MFASFSAENLKENFRNAYLLHCCYVGVFTTFVSGTVGSDSYE